MEQKPLDPAMLINIVFKRVPICAFVKMDIMIMELNCANSAIILV